MDSFPRMEPHPGLFKHTKELNNIDAMRSSAAQISGVDDGVGEVMAALERLGLAGNTLVVFTSDQGTAGGHHGIWGMGHNTKPSVAYDSVQQVPLIIRQPGQVPAEKTCDFLVNNYDMMPFILDYVGLRESIPQNSPGRSFADAVRAQRDRGAAVIMSTHDMGDAQKLCDRILLIDKGERLLYGTVDGVRDAFSDGAVQVSGTNIPSSADKLQSVTDVHEVDGAMRYLIGDDATPQDLFRELAATGAQVEQFAVQAPSLDEIFIRTVAGDPRAEAVR